MTEATNEDKWPDGFVPVVVKVGSSFAIEKTTITITFDDAMLGAGCEALRSKVGRAIDSFDKLVEACEAALSALIAHTGDAATSSSGTTYEQTLLRAALAEARKRET